MGLLLESRKAEVAMQKDSQKRAISERNASKSVLFDENIIMI